MKKITNFALIIGIVLTGMIISGCTDNNDNMNSNHPITPVSQQQTVSDISIREALDNPYAYDTVRITGTVNQTIDIPGYTLMEINDSTGIIWVAGFSTILENGSQIIVTGSLNENFHSSTLNTTFKIIVLADSVFDMSTSSNTSTSNSPHKSSSTTDVNVTAIEGGTRIEEILNDPGAFQDQEIRVAAVVLKNVVLINYSMLTIEDGTGQLKAKSPNSFEYSAGEEIIVTGTVLTDVSLGSGYNYDILLQVSSKE